MPATRAAELDPVEALSVIARVLEMQAETQAILAKQAVPRSVRRSKREAQALGILTLMESPGLSLNQIAREVGCDKRTLTESPHFQRLREAC